MKDRKLKGFSLIEILVVVALILILATITIVAMNPAKHFADTRNANRSSDIAALLDAVTQYAAEEGNAIADFGTISLCDSATEDPNPIGTGAGNINLATLLVDEYIVAIPMDPSVGTEENTGYTICRTDGGRVQLEAPNAENEKQIVVKR